MSRFLYKQTQIPGVKLFERRVLSDDRGFLSRLFCAEELIDLGWSCSVNQINHTFTRGIGTVRGLHYQLPPKAEKKLVSCIRGEIWDILVDLRSNSSTFLKWHAELLSEANRKSLLIPEGVAHGFQVQSDSCELIYLHSTEHSPEFERGLNPRDPMLKIKWPREITKISDRDNNHPFLKEDFRGDIY